MTEGTALILAGEGYGNIIMATPLMSAVAQLGYETHVLVQANWPDAAGLLHGWPMLGGVYTQWAEAEGMKWDVAVETVWNRSGHRARASDHVIPRYQDLRDTHEADANMTAAIKLGWLGITPAPHCEYGQKPANLPRTAYVAVCPGWGGHPPRRTSEWRRKAWPRWQEFCAQSHLPIVALGSKVEADEWPVACQTHFGTLNIRDAAAVLKDAKFVVAVDNGLAHIAGALGVRTVVLFGATSTAKNRPQGCDVRIVDAPVDCRPCQMTERWHSCKRHFCMGEITPQMVWEAAA